MFLKMKNNDIVYKLFQIVYNILKTMGEMFV